MEDKKIPSIYEKASQRKKCNYCEKGELHEHVVLVDEGIRDYILGIGKLRPEMTCICEGCGICTKMERETVFLKNDIFSIISDQNARCETCNSYTDGSTLKIFSPLLKKIKTDTYRELQHRPEINLECAREASYLSTLEEVEEKLNKKRCEDGIPRESIAWFQVKNSIEELRQGGMKNEQI